ncbi:MAG: rod shape-determining protein MreD [Candidatus Omnitrophica bacterium]|nr:rod shape-determining protein MreD [Candidatus Omnitrophota bacterium]
MYRLLPPRFIAALGAVILCEMYFFGYLIHSPFRPDLWVVFLVYYHFFYDRHRILLFALVLGITRDILGQGAFGASTFSMVVGALVLIRLGATLNRERFYVQMFSVLCVSLAVLGFQLCVESAVFKEWIWVSRFAPRVLTISVITCLTSPLILGVMQKFLGPMPHQYELFS